MATTGALNGTKVFLRVKNNADIYVSIGGQLSHTETMNNNIIDITSKTCPDFRQLLPGKGIQQADYSAEVLFVSQEGYDIIRAMAGTKEIRTFEVSADGVPATEVQLAVNSFADTSESDSALKGTIGLISSDVITHNP